MKKSLWKLLPLIFGVILTPSASAEVMGAYIPFVAVDAVNGTFDQSVRNELDRSSIGYKLLTSPITVEQLKGASILLISGAFRNELTGPKAGETDHRLYSNKEIASIENFVNEGGTLIGAGLCWAWTYSGYGNKNHESFPLNQIGEALNFSVLGQCDFVKFDRKFLSLVKEPKNPVGSAFSNVEFKGASHKYIHSTNGICGAGAKRGNGYIYIFGHQIILINHPEFVSTVFLGLSPQKRTKTALVDNDPKESEAQKQETSHDNVVAEKTFSSDPSVNVNVSASKILATNILLKKGQKFSLVPNKSDEWCGGGSKAGVFCDYMGYQFGDKKWMRMMFKIGNGQEFPVEAGVLQTAQQDGELLLYAYDKGPVGNTGNIRVGVEVSANFDTVDAFPENKGNTDTPPPPQTLPKEALSNINPLDLLAQEGSNMIAWVTSPLDVDIPDNFRANISLLREDILDGHAEGSASPEIYQSVVELCDNLMACIDKKEKQQIDAKLRLAHAKQRSPLSNQALEARRNYMMSWPQYHREVRQREVLAEEKNDTTEVKASELELAWIETAGKLRKSLDVKYSAYRAALRKK